MNPKRAAVGWLGALITGLFLALPTVPGPAGGLVVYPPVPGLAASEHYQVRVRSAEAGSPWQSAFAWETACKAIEKGYVNGWGIRRTVLWNDANGSSFVLSALPQLTDRQLVVEDCDVIYARAKWHHWSGGRVFNMRGEGGGPAGAGVVFRNINIEDPRPTLQQFFICMAVPAPYAKEGNKRKAGDLSGVLFQNISMAAPSVLGEPQILWGQPEAHIRNLTFENLTLAGKPVRGPAFFKTNEFVEGLIFAPGMGAKPGKQ